MHSRIESQAQAFQRRCRVGNVYVNRNQIGAVVGVQPFGGRGLSGTGPKAGGPHYLAALRLRTHRHREHRRRRRQRNFALARGVASDAVWIASSHDRAPARSVGSQCQRPRSTSVAAPASPAIVSTPRCRWSRRCRSSRRALSDLRGARRAHARDRAEPPARGSRPGLFAVSRRLSAAGPGRLPPARHPHRHQHGLGQSAGRGEAGARARARARASRGSRSRPSPATICSPRMTEAEVRAQPIMEGIALGERPIVAANAYLGARPVAAALATGAHVVLVGRTHRCRAVARAAAARAWLGGGRSRPAGARHRVRASARMRRAGHRSVLSRSRLQRRPGPRERRLPDRRSRSRRRSRRHQGSEHGRAGEPRHGHRAAPVRGARPAQLSDARCRPRPRRGHGGGDRPDRVRVRGARGKPPPPTLKATVCVDAGWLGEGEISYAGPNALARAELAAAVVRTRCQRSASPIPCAWKCWAPRLSSTATPRAPRARFPRRRRRVSRARRRAQREPQDRAAGIRRGAEPVLLRTRRRGRRPPARHDPDQHGVDPGRSRPSQATVTLVEAA